MRARLGQVNEERAPHRVARSNTKTTEKGTVNKRQTVNQESTTLKIHSSNFLVLQDSERVRIQKNTKHKTFFDSVTNKLVTTTTGTKKLHITPSLEGKKKKEDEDPNELCDPSWEKKVWHRIQAPKGERKR